MNEKHIFFEENGSIKLEWVSNEAERFAKQLERYSLSTTQLRKFYNEFLRIRDLPKNSSEKIVLLKLLVAKVQYKKHNSPKEMNQIFVDFITQLVESVETSEKRFENACLIMEAVVGYFPKK